jgi:hypothetical protein
VSYLRVYRHLEGFCRDIGYGSMMAQVVARLAILRREMLN